MSEKYIYRERVLLCNRATNPESIKFVMSKNGAAGNLTKIVVY